MAGLRFFCLWLLYILLLFGRFLHLFVRILLWLSLRCVYLLLILDLGRCRIGIGNIAGKACGERRCCQCGSKHKFLIHGDNPLSKK